MGSRKAPKADDIDNVIKLASELITTVGAHRIDVSHMMTRVYALRRGGEKSDALHRIGGLPPGGTSLTWPEKNGVAMVHLFTLDLAAMPELRELVVQWKRCAPDDVRTLGGTPENRPTKDTAKPANGQAADWVFMPVAAQISYQPSFGSSVARR